ncbi:MAG: hypothetical protein CSA24_03020 [Deltaproteobacteria bacterium]|nr:MAG: hypothetical protein CSA24_03020 [Deltaproteobacteria bacterium]
MPPAPTVYRLPALMLFLLVSFVGPAGCAPRPATTPADPLGTLQFLESWPEGTVLDTPAFSEAYRIWPQVLRGARKSIDVGSFYYSRKGDGRDADGPDSAADRLLPSTAALRGAAERGVAVRVLGDAKFQKNYPEFLAEMAALPGATSRAVDLGPLWGGVMHAKYFVVDDRILYVGSQNWDWRALTQIRELGALIDHPGLAAKLKRVFAMDWALAGDDADRKRANRDRAHQALADPAFADLRPARLQTPDGRLVDAYLAASPRAGLPTGIPWDLPLLREMIDGATKSVRCQVLSYHVSDRDGGYFPDLDVALRRAAARGVQVRLLVSNWSKVSYKLPWLQSLAAVRNITVKFSNIPQLQDGFIPYGRVEHPKYMVVDGTAAWVGTSNWSGDYFHSSRNVSLFFRGAGAAEPLEEFFARGWDSPYTEVVDPCGEYTPPRRK